jgi:hypothetical protein
MSSLAIIAAYESCDRIFDWVTAHCSSFFLDKTPLVGLEVLISSAEGSQKGYFSTACYTNSFPHNQCKPVGNELLSNSFSTWRHSFWQTMWQCRVIWQ